MTSATIETLGDLRDYGMSLTWYCAGCSGRIALTLAEAIERFGSGQRYINWQLPGFECSRCSDRRTTMIVQPVPDGYALPGR
ncbi:hypothetical protein [Jiella avicenniae]|uniref:Uncharacterized protein n=1 Tax=Jiella avicenniae TaxID=2907202 RepID=A0A9X1T558_9HYPH|nr:hypothetical protein [Jiella avicenniae]MCE7028494.1 hypothetical protein [Jiella avicenniae]